MLDSIERPEYPGDPLPEWVTRLRPHQVRAVNACLDAFSEVDLVILDAPVGSGKTLIGELVRRELHCNGTYICTDRQLQDQVLADFPYARVLKGRSNYTPHFATGAITCDDCQLPGGCKWCGSQVSTCPYKVAKESALAAELAVLNTSMFLAAANYARFFVENDLIIADECDLLEGALIGFIEFEFPQWLGKLMKLQYPIKGARKPTIIKWLVDLRDRLDNVKMQLTDPKQLRTVDGLKRGAFRIADMLSKDLASGNTDDGEDAGHWVRDYDTATFKMRPVTVANMTDNTLWRYGNRWLLMSGTVVSAEELVESLGWDGEYRVVTVPSTFPVENRRIISAPIADMTRRVGERDWPKLLKAIENIITEYQGRVLVHTVSYKLAQYLYSQVLTDRPTFTHANSRDKLEALREYQATEDAVLFSPSMARGVDLHGDLCRVQIICKCPFPSLGDKQVSSRLRLPGGELWYAVQTAREIVQMTGRGVRSKTDYCATFIMDQQFPRNIWRKHKHLFTEAFKDAVDMKADVRWLYK